MESDICGQQVVIDGAWFTCNLPPRHECCRLCSHLNSRHTRMGCADCAVCVTPRYDFEPPPEQHHAQGDVPVRFTLEWVTL